MIIGFYIFFSYQNNPIKFNVLVSDPVSDLFMLYLLISIAIII